MGAGKRFQGSVSALDGPPRHSARASGADESDHGSFVGDDMPDDLSASLISALDFDRVCAVDLGAILSREAHLARTPASAVVHPAASLPTRGLAWSGDLAATAGAPRGIVLGEGGAASRDMRRWSCVMVQIALPH